MRRYLPALFLVLSLVILGKGILGVATVLRPVATPMAEHRAEAASETLNEAAESARLAASIESLAAALTAPASGQAPLQELLPDEDGQAADSGPPQRQVEVVYLTRDYRRAVIDGLLVAEGDRLPEGGRVRRIAEAGIVVDERRGHQTLRVEHQRLVVGSVHRVKQGEAP